MVEQVEQDRVAWVDTDAGGRIHFTAVFRWAEQAETALIRRLGLLDATWGDYPRRKVEAEYLKVSCASRTRSRSGCASRRWDGRR